MKEYIVLVRKEDDVPFTKTEYMEELVRCKDCKHRDPEDKKCDSGHFIQWQLPRDDDWFCADGEKVTK